MLQAKTPALKGESEAAGVGKFGVFRFGVDVVVQLQLTGGEHDDVLRIFRMHQDLLRMRNHMFSASAGSGCSSACQNGCASGSAGIR